MRLDAHDVGQLKDGRPVFVNTLYNCLGTPPPPSKRRSRQPSIVSNLGFMAASIGF
jgi:hypothetical protein